MGCCPCSGTGCNRCFDNPNDPSVLMKCCRCFTSRVPSTLVQCYRYIGAGWPTLCAAFNTDFVLTADLQNRSDKCRWSCTTGVISLALQYYSFGDYFEFCISDGTHTACYRQSAASFCNGGQVFSLFNNGGCSPAPATIQLIGLDPKSIINCCLCNSMPDTLFLTIMGTGCTAISNLTVPLLLDPGSDQNTCSWTGLVPASGGGLIEFGLVCIVNNYSLSIGPKETSCLPSVCDADCSLTTCSPVHIVFKGCNVAYSSSRCPECFGVTPTSHPYDAVVTA